MDLKLDKQIPQPHPIRLTLHYSNPKFIIFRWQHDSKAYQKNGYYIYIKFLCAVEYELPQNFLPPTIKKSTFRIFYFMNCIMEHDVRCCYYYNSVDTFGTRWSIFWGGMGCLVF
jgi:hypothetical protein